MASNGFRFRNSLKDGLPFLRKADCKDPRSGSAVLWPLPLGSNVCVNQARLCFDAVTNTPTSQLHYRNLLLIHIGYVSRMEAPYVVVSQGYMLT